MYAYLLNVQGTGSGQLEATINKDHVHVAMYACKLNASHDSFADHGSGVRAAQSIRGCYALVVSRVVAIMKAAPT